MKRVLMLLCMVFCLCSARAQTNIINISNSRVVINNYYVTTPTNSVPVTNVVSEVKSNKVVVLPQEWVERLRWEGFLLERQAAYNRAYIRRIERER